MKKKKILQTAVLISFLSLNSLSWAASKNNVLDVNIDVPDSNGSFGTVTIIQEVDGRKNTIEESFEYTQGADMSALIDAILTKHGIDSNQNKGLQKISKAFDTNNKDLAWVQKSRDINVNLNAGQATVILKKDNNGEVEIIEETYQVDEDTNIDEIIDTMMIEHGIEADDIKVHKKIIKLDRSSSKISQDKPRLGIMATTNQDGWEIISVVPDSGAEEAGLLKGDVIVSVNNQKTSKDGMGLLEFTAMDHQPGDMNEIKILRDGKELTLNAKTKVINSPDVIIGGHKSINSLGQGIKLNYDDLDKMMEGLDVNVEHIDNMVKGLGNPEIHVVTTSDADAYFFSGSKMNQWLGHNHHFSTITEGLGKYFGTSQGVLILEVDKNNKLGLKDGDVIQAINGEDVSSPKDVVKIMSGFKSDESFEIEIMREKETIYLES